MFPAHEVRGERDVPAKKKKAGGRRPEKGGRKYQPKKIE
jgi:hypothetical protein